MRQLQRCRRNIFGIFLRGGGIHRHQRHLTPCRLFLGMPETRAGHATMIGKEAEPAVGDRGASHQPGAPHRTSRHGRKHLSRSEIAGGQQLLGLADGFFVALFPTRHSCGGKTTQARDAAQHSAERQHLLQLGTPQHHARDHQEHHAGQHGANNEPDTAEILEQPAENQHDQHV